MGLKVLASGDWPQIKRQMVQWLSRQIVKNGLKTMTN
jgi:hypothetical protein